MGLSTTNVFAVVVAGLVIVGCGESGATQGKGWPARVATPAETVVVPKVDVSGFVDAYDAAPIYDRIDLQPPRAIEDVLAFQCEGYIDGTVVGAKSLSSRVSLSQGNPNEPPDFWLDQLAVGLIVKVDNSTTAGRAGPSSETVVALPFWAGKLRENGDERQFKRLSVVLDSPPVGARIGVFVRPDGATGTIEPCLGGYGVVLAQPDGTGMATATLVGESADGAVDGYSSMDQLRHGVESTLAAK